MRNPSSDSRSGVRKPPLSKRVESIVEIVVSEANNLVKSKHMFSKKSAKALLAAFTLGLCSIPLQAEPLRSHQVPLVVERMTQLYGSGQLASGLTGLLEEDPLAHLLALQKRHWPSAWVTSTFYDWRTVSRYRRTAGLHLGYDVALPFGTPVSAGWAGRVTAIVPWTDTEYGVTVTSPQGLSVTYGHITPGVQLGDPISVGSVVGRIASDHVDVKMRDASGRFIPFGEESNPALALVPNVDNRALLTAWLVARNSVEQAEEDLFLRRNASKKRELEQRSAQRKVEILEETLKELRGPQSEGLVARKTVEKFKAELNAARRQLIDLKAQEHTSSSALESSLHSCRSNLQAIEGWALSRGLAWKDVEQLVASTIIKNQELKKAVLAEKNRGPSEPSLSQEDLKKKRTNLARLEDLYEKGGLSRQEIEEERLRLELLEEEFRLRHKRQQK